MESEKKKIRITAIEDMQDVYAVLNVDPNRAKDPRLNALYVYECGRVIEETDDAYYHAKGDGEFETLDEAEAALFKPA